MKKDAIRQYKQDGYHIARGLLPRGEVARVFSDMHQLAVRQLQHYGLPHEKKGAAAEEVHRDLQSLFKRDLKTYLATLSLSSKLLSLYDLFLHPAMRDAIATLGLDVPLWQTGPVFHLMSQALKVPDGYHGFDMHQDWPSQQGGLDAVTVWIPLTDVDRAMFTMELIPGSHLGGLYPRTSGQFLQIDPASYDAKKLVPIEAHAGDVVFFSAFMLHRSSPKGDNRLRVSTSIRYENAAEPHFIERGYPAGQKRSPVPELITPGFPAPELVRKVFE